MINTESAGVNRSDGVNGSYGVINSYGVDNQFFCADKKREYFVFMKAVTKERYEKIYQEWYNLLNGWRPSFNNAVELYSKSGSSWKNVDASKITRKLDNWEEPYEAWKDMPKAALDYVKALPEFDIKIFKRVTGIDIQKDNENQIKAEELRKKAEEMLKAAKELEKNIL